MSSNLYSVEDRVVVQWEETKCSFTGVIQKVHTDERTYDVLYDQAVDGKSCMEQFIRHDRIQHFSNERNDEVNGENDTYWTESPSALVGKGLIHKDTCTHVSLNSSTYSSASKGREKIISTILQLGWSGMQHLSYGARTGASPQNDEVEEDEDATGRGSRAVVLSDSELLSLHDSLTTSTVITLYACLSGSDSGDSKDPQQESAKVQGDVSSRPAFSCSTKAGYVAHLLMKALDCKNNETCVGADVQEDDEPYSNRGEGMAAVIGSVEIAPVSFIHLWHMQEPIIGTQPQLTAWLKHISSHSDRSGANDEYRDREEGEGAGAGALLRSQAVIACLAGLFRLRAGYHAACEQVHLAQSQQAMYHYSADKAPVPSTTAADPPTVKVSDIIPPAIPEELLLIGVRAVTSFLKDQFISPKLSSLKLPQSISGENENMNSSSSSSSSASGGAVTGKIRGGKSNKTAVYFSKGMSEVALRVFPQVSSLLSAIAWYLNCSNRNSGRSGSSIGGGGGNASASGVHGNDRLCMLGTELAIMALRADPSQTTLLEALMTLSPSTSGSSSSSSSTTTAVRRRTSSPAIASTSASTTASSSNARNTTTTNGKSVLLNLHQSASDVLREAFAAFPHQRKALLVDLLALLAQSSSHKAPFKSYALHYNTHVSGDASCFTSWPLMTLLSCLQSTIELDLPAVSTPAAVDHSGSALPAATDSGRGSAKKKGKKGRTKQQGDTTAAATIDSGAATTTNNADAKKSLAQCYRCCAVFVGELFQRCIHKEMGVEYRTLATYLVSELLSVIQLPAWPVSAILMEQIVLYILKVLQNGCVVIGTSESKRDNSFVTFIIDLLGNACVGHRTILLTADHERNASERQGDRAYAGLSTRAMQSVEEKIYSLKGQWLSNLKPNSQHLGASDRPDGKPKSYKQSTSTSGSTRSLEDSTQLLALPVALEALLEIQTLVVDALSEQPFLASLQVPGSTSSSSLEEREHNEVDNSTVVTAGTKGLIAVSPGSAVSVGNTNSEISSAWITHSDGSDDGNKHLPVVPRPMDVLKHMQRHTELASLFPAIPAVDNQYYHVVRSLQMQWQLEQGQGQPRHQPVSSSAGCSSSNTPHHMGNPGYAYAMHLALWHIHATTENIATVGAPGISGGTGTHKGTTAVIQGLMGAYLKDASTDSRHGKSSLHSSSNQDAIAHSSISDHQHTTTHLIARGNFSDEAVMPAYRGVLCHRTINLMFTHILDALLSMTCDPTPAVRAKTIRSLAPLLQCDCDLILQHNVREAITGRMFDGSISVREEAVKLLGWYVVKGYQNANLSDDYLEALKERLHDEGVSVRKSVVNLIKEILLHQPDHPQYQQLCLSLLSKANHPKEEESVKEIVRSTFQQIWFLPPRKGVVSAQLSLKLRQAGGSTNASPAGVPPSQLQQEQQEQQEQSEVQKVGGLTAPADLALDISSMQSCPAGSSNGEGLQCGSSISMMMDATTTPRPAEANAVGAVPHQGFSTADSNGRGCAHIQGKSAKAASKGALKSTYNDIPDGSDGRSPMELPRNGGDPAMNTSVVRLLRTSSGGSGSGGEITPLEGGTTTRSSTHDTIAGSGGSSGSGGGNRKEATNGARAEHVRSIALQLVGMAALNLDQATEWIVEIMRELLHGTSEGDEVHKQMLERRRDSFQYCAELVKCLIELLLCTEERHKEVMNMLQAMGKDHKQHVVDVISTVALFCTAHPPFIGPHLKTLLPYLKQDNTFTPAQNEQIKLKIMEIVSAATVLNESAKCLNFDLSEVLNDLSKCAVTMNGGKNIKAAVTCLALIAANVTHDAAPLLRLAQYCYKILYKISLKVSPTRPAAIPTGTSSSSIAGTNAAAAAAAAGMLTPGEIGNLQRALTVLGYVCESSKKCTLSMQKLGEQINSRQGASTAKITPTGAGKQTTMTAMTASSSRSNPSVGAFYSSVEANRSIAATAIQKLSEQLHPSTIYGSVYSAAVFALHVPVVKLQERAVQALCGVFVGCPRLMLLAQDTGLLSQLLLGTTTTTTTASALVGEAASLGSITSTDSPAAAARVSFDDLVREKFLSALKDLMLAEEERVMGHQTLQQLKEAGRAGGVGDGIIDEEMEEEDEGEEESDDDDDDDDEEEGAAGRSGGGPGGTKKRKTNGVMPLDRQTKKEKQRKRRRSGRTSDAYGNKVNSGVRRVVLGNLEHDSDSTIAGFTLQQHFPSIRACLCSGECKLRHTALLLIGTLLRQGMLSPPEVIAPLIALQGDDATLVPVRQEALHILLTADERFPTFVSSRMLDGVELTWAYQRNRTAATVAATVEGTGTMGGGYGTVGVTQPLLDADTWFQQLQQDQSFSDGGKSNHHTHGQMYSDLRAKIENGDALSIFSEFYIACIPAGSPRRRDFLRGLLNRAYSSVTPIREALAQHASSFDRQELPAILLLQQQAQQQCQQQQQKQQKIEEGKEDIESSASTMNATANSAPAAQPAPVLPLIKSPPPLTANNTPMTKKAATVAAAAAAAAAAEDLQVDTTLHDAFTKAASCALSCASLASLPFAVVEEPLLLIYLINRSIPVRTSLLLQRLRQQLATMGAELRQPAKMQPPMLGSKPRVSASVSAASGVVVGTPTMGHSDSSSSSNNNSGGGGGSAMRRLSSTSAGSGSTGSGSSPAFSTTTSAVIGSGEHQEADLLINEKSLEMWLASSGSSWTMARRICEIVVLALELRSNEALLRLKSCLKTAYALSDERCSTFRGDERNALNTGGENGGSSSSDGGGGGGGGSGGGGGGVVTASLPVDYKASPDAVARLDDLLPTSLLTHLQPEARDESAANNQNNSKARDPLNSDTSTAPSIDVDCITVLLRQLCMDYNRITLLLSNDPEDFTLAVSASTKKLHALKQAAMVKANNKAAKAAAKVAAGGGAKNGGRNKKRPARIGVGTGTGGEGEEEEEEEEESVAASGDGKTGRKRGRPAGGGKTGKTTTSRNGANKTAGKLTTSRKSPKKRSRSVIYHSSSDEEEEDGAGVVYDEGEDEEDEEEEEEEEEEWLE